MIWLTNELKLFLGPPQTSFINKEITHSNWNTCLRSKLCPNTSSLPTQPNLALIQPTSSFNRDTPFAKGNFTCLIVVSPNIKSPYTSLPSRIPWPLIIRPTHSRFALEKSGIPNHVVWTTSSDYTKSRVCILAPGALHVPNHVPTLNQWTVTPFHKRTPWYLMWHNHATL